MLMTSTASPETLRKRPLRGLFKHLGKSKSGLALTEFAFSLPIFLGLGMFGTEMAYLAITSMNVSQAALSLADNASRMGQTVTGSSSKTIYRSDVNSVFAGARLQGDEIDLLENGRVILSSLETTNNGRWQRIRWQRCIGTKNYSSDYGPQGINERNDSSFVGMGPAGEEIRAERGSAVMYVEIFYEYPGLFGDSFVSGQVIKHEAAFTIRDDRNLAEGVANDGARNPHCNRFTAS
ncbi:TadE/TadG family type IV pilus assembly protein [Alterisphingorhabdus coralli]|uniref:Pilus assembly protein TadE n=1 Tax=Alterisphingorhabdus coralli TaxID=3071408 RepID=A0AA97F7S0_9SPHN|nr:pilus assembly protein TadE [Parasphingorhabdus sp. SCSIO 66989]WOE74080.1 pilus assembly protein TadE [Parasphingorhabdus sp. SCSIO 66989]